MSQWQPGEKGTPASFRSTAPSPGRPKAPKPRGRLGRAPHEPNKHTKSTVEFLYATGWPVERIAKAMSLSKSSLRRYYKDKLEAGKARIDAAVTQSIVMMAIGGGGDGAPPDWEKAVPSMAQLWAKARMGWNDRPNTVESFDQFQMRAMTTMSEEQLERLIRRLSSDREAAGTRLIEGEVLARGEDQVPQGRGGPQGR
jgi:hypothetical protein